MERRIALEGCLNFRDLGGYRGGDGRMVRWRRLFRSDTLTALTGADVAVIREQLGIDDVIDLRSSGEIRREGRGPLGEHRLRFHHAPLIDSDATMQTMRDASLSLGERYLVLADRAREPVAQVLTIVAEASGAVLYHCAAGKDRTGMVSAVLLGVLGVSPADIAADYAASQQHIDAIIERLMRQEGYREMLKCLPPDTLRAGGETMERFLEQLTERYGSVEGYARAAGVSEATVDRLRARLLIDDGR
ncbi:MAG: tyrosine-protein phosphatase [Candidatus Binatia bacterium]